MNAREADLIAERYQAREQAFDNLHTLLLPVFRRTSLAESMKEISECVSEAAAARSPHGTDRQQQLAGPKRKLRRAPATDRAPHPQNAA